MSTPTLYGEDAAEKNNRLKRIKKEYLSGKGGSRLM